MNNDQIPPVQFSGSGFAPQSGLASPADRPMVQQVQVMPEKKKDVSGLVKTIVLIAVSLVAATFLGLFIWMSVQYGEAQETIEEKVSVAETKARDEQSAKDEADFLEREKYPYRTFSGPADYGQLTFEYPKTWSLYIDKDASNGGDYIAYFNPVQIEEIGNNAINALSVYITN